MVAVNEDGRLNAQNTLNADCMIKIFKDFDVDIVVLPEFGGDAEGDKPDQRMFALRKKRRSTVKLRHWSIRRDWREHHLPAFMDRWKRDLDFIAKEIILKNKEAIIIGDFNATNRHCALNFIDSLELSPRLKRGTLGLFLPRTHIK